MPATEKYWRSLSTMHVVFAGSALALLGATLVMMVFDQDRDWRQYQLQAEDLRHKKLESDRDLLTSGDYEQELERLEASAQQAKVAYDSQADETSRLQTELDELTGEITLLERQVKFKNAEVGVARANLDIAVRDSAAASALAGRQLAFDTQETEARKMATRLDEIKTRRDAVRDQLAALEADKTRAEAALAAYQEDVTRVNEQMQLLRPTSRFASIKRTIKRWPIINGFNPEIRIIQDWIPDLKQQLGMAKVARFDRCRTCHVHIDQFGTANVPTFPHGTLAEGRYPQPYSSHPRPDVYLTDGSPHPLGVFGCTSCHEGDGSGTSFQTAEHTPTDPGEAHRWQREHGWHANHFWEYPMHSGSFLESGCLKCHQSVVELGVNSQYGATAPKLYEGYELIQQYGCFGCHEINGFDGRRAIGPDLRLEPQTEEEAEKIAADPNQIAGNLRKVGPSLRHIGEKTTPEFVAFWTEEPRRFRPETRMPQFFHLSNQDDVLAQLLQPVELAGIAAYLMDRSEALPIMQPVEGYEPNAERGKRLFSRRGCLACHSHNDPDFAGIRSDFGPNLTNVHEKIRPGVEGFNWVYTWIRDPERHHPWTRMPNLFLAPEGEGDRYVDPAADVAAFLLQGGYREFPQIELPGAYIGIVIAGEQADEHHAAHGDQEHEAADEANEETTEGIAIAEVLRGGPAERAMPAPAAGRDAPASADALPVLVPGDVLTAWNGAALRGVEQLRELESQTAVGDTVTLSRVRGGEASDVVLAASDPLTDLTRMYLRKQMTADEVDAALERGMLVDRRGTVGAGGEVSFAFDVISRDTIKGDEIELARRADDPDTLDPAEIERRKLLYVGRRTISRYGCYGCHDIPGYEQARPIGTALQDWGRKDTSKLAPEHIEEYLHHSGEPDGSSTHERMERIVHSAVNDDAGSHTDRMAAFFYESLMHHGRAGFLWQKVREPRSYDYMKTDTKGWDERLRMPKFPFSEDQIESIATFVLGLVADPPPEMYLFRPTAAAHARIEGERLLDKYNCTSCHMVEMPGFRYQTDLRPLVGMSRRELVTWIVDNADAVQQGSMTQAALAGREPAERASATPAEILPADFQQPLRTFFANAEKLLADRGPIVENLQTDLAPLLADLAGSGGAAAVNAWLDRYPEVLLADPIPDADVPKSVRLSIGLKPPVDRSGPVANLNKPHVIELHGLTFAEPDPEEPDPEFREYAFELWENAEIAGRYKLAGISSRYVFPETSVQESLPGRGGEFARWLVPQLRDHEMSGDVSKSWQAAPPPLYKEGVKVQTPWLYRFLKNPEQLRYTTVLRMPRFNMSDEEAQSLANYFAAVDGAAFPYQRIRKQEPAYLTDKQANFDLLFPSEEDTYLSASWKTLNTPLCVKCHSVGGRAYQGSDPTKDIRGPNLERVQQRLRSDWLHLWVFKPTAITPFTSMPQNFPHNQQQFPELFAADPLWQVEAVEDALMNYYNLLEVYGETVYPPPGAAPPAEAPTEGEGESPAEPSAETNAGGGGG